MVHASEWSSSETQGQIVGPVGNWGERKQRRRRRGRERDKGLDVFAESAHRKFGKSLLFQFRQSSWKRGIIIPLLRWSEHRCNIHCRWASLLLFCAVLALRTDGSALARWFSVASTASKTWPSQSRSFCSFCSQPVNSTLHMQQRCTAFFSLCFSRFNSHYTEFFRDYLLFSHQSSRPRSTPLNGSAVWFSTSSQALFTDAL